MKKIILFFLLFISVNAQTILNPGDIVVVAINGDADASNGFDRGFSFMPLVYLEEGTVINFTDYGWSDVTSAFITNAGIADAFIHYTVPSGGLTAGTIIRCDSYSHNNFTFDFNYSGSGTNNYLNTAGLTQGDELLIFQGDRSAPTFIFAATIVSTTIVASGWATNVGTNGTDGSGAGSALPPGLTDDVTALSFNRPATGNDNASYSGITIDAAKTDWQNRIKNYANWTFTDVPPIPTPLTGPFIVTDALPVELISFVALVVNNKVNLNWQTATEVNNYGFEVERILLGPTPDQDGLKWEKIGFVEGHGNSNSPKEYSFIDTNPIAGSVQYRLKQINLDGSFTYYSRLAEVKYNLTDVTEKQQPKEFALEQNYPNPFNPGTSIKYAISSVQNVSLKLYDILGNEVAELVNETKSPGYYEEKFNAVNLAAGIYFYKLTAGSFTSTKKLILLK